MNTNNRLVAAGVLAAGLMSGLAAAASAQELTLRYRWTKGEEVRYRMTQESTATISGLPGGMPDMNVVTTMSQVVRSVVENVAPDGSATIRHTYESVRMNMDSPMAKMAYDSTAKDMAAGDPMMKDMFSAMIGESFVLVMSPTGAVQKVEGMGALMEKMFKKMPQDPAAAGMLNGIKSSFTDDAMRQAFSQSSSQFPDRPVKPGDTWSNQLTFNNPMLGATTTSTTSTFGGVEGAGGAQMAKITTKLAIKLDSATPATNPMGLTMKMGDSTGEGEFLFDVAKGRQQRGTTRTNVAIMMSGSGPDGAALSMQTLVKGTLTVEIVQ
jgi:hypothetical protein